MKKVIFICLLSLSLCLSKPADEQAKPMQQQNAPAMDAKITNPTDTSQTPTKSTMTEQKGAPMADNNAATHPEAATGPNETKVNPPQATTDENKTKKETEPPKEEAKKAEPPKEEAKKAEPSKEEAKKEEPAKEEAKKVEPSKDAQGTTEAKPVADNKEAMPKPEEKTEKGTVTTTEKANVTTKPTEAPKKQDDKPVLQARGFDGPSFVGGIILTLGLLAISFMGFKYYKNQAERNYHTL